MKKVSWIVLLIMSSCSPEESNPSPAPPKTKPLITWSTFTILPGEHNCEESTLMTTLSDTLEFRAVFDSSALYIFQDPVNQKDWNKLFGFSDCSSFHQTNSFRLGWRPLVISTSKLRKRYPSCMLSSL